MQRRQFNLLKGDITYLSGLTLEWETVIDDGLRWLLIYNYPLPDGYSNELVILAVKIEAGYPRAPLDMVYFFPAVSRMDGIFIRALSQQIIDGKKFQRWSRHRPPTDSWRPGVDNLASHLCIVGYWLDNELTRREYVVTR